MPATPDHKTAGWQRFRLAILRRDLWTCQMCGCLLRQGRKAGDTAVVDHLMPVDLRPDLFWDVDEVRSVCRSCHALCDGIEKRLSPDAEAIKTAKLACRPVGLDGYRA